MSRPQAPPVLVTAGILRREHLYLVCQRRADGHHPGKWEFPGGKVEGDETLPECLRRELHEELDIEAEIGAEVWRTRFQYPGRPRFELVFFAVVAYRGAIANRAFADIRWVRREELMQLDFLDGDRELIRLVAAGEIVDL